MRLFFALWPPLAVARQLAEIAASATGRLGGKATRQETIHLTLAFLGNVPEERLPLVLQAARSIKGRSFALNLDRLGYWKHNHLLWAGISTPSPDLNELASSLHHALAESGIALDGENRVFTPHVTLGRKLPEASAVPELPAIPAITWPCSRFMLVHSRVSATGSFYEMLAEFPLD